ncbi:MAG TPA: L-seryl-tRNA(Sec) selenium transferase [Candidatus Limnocylindria bacterium]|nr:L-seryl-tRNA(Sec) selenium transferase [Candidatus Limnocylindria bacterium]
MATRASPLRALPAVETLLQHPALADATRELPRTLVVESVRAVLAAERARLGARREAPAGAQELAERAAERARQAHRPVLRRVLNATGVVLHTNLGRAPLALSARAAVEAVGRGYCSLEFDLETGRRSERGAGVERWLTRLTGAESALVVNNGAAAVLLALAALASGRRVVVSRGELVEIGGSFRIPEILERSGATLVEVGTTNRTHLRDYQRALERHRGEVGAVLRVHRSNFRIEGFTTRPSLEELSALTRRHRVPLIEDLGSGALADLSAMGLEREPTVRESLTAGCDLVTFSGDKLLGSTQAGLLLGRRRLVERARKDPLARALRVDKLTLAALEATLPVYSDAARAVREIPVLAMLQSSPETLERRARALADAIRLRVPSLLVSVERGAGEVGGGALPLQRLPGWVVALEHPERAVDELDRWARGADPPVVGYIRTGKFRMDVRTLSDPEVEEAAEALGKTPL